MPLLQIRNQQSGRPADIHAYVKRIGQTTLVSNHSGITANAIMEIYDGSLPAGDTVSTSHYMQVHISEIRDLYSYMLYNIATCSTCFITPMLHSQAAACVKRQDVYAYAAHNTVMGIRHTFDLPLPLSPDDDFIYNIIWYAWARFCSSLHIYQIQSDEF